MVGLWRRWFKRLIRYVNYASLKNITYKCSQCLKMTLGIRGFGAWFMGGNLQRLFHYLTSIFRVHCYNTGVNGLTLYGIGCLVVTMSIQWSSWV